MHIHHRQLSDLIKGYALGDNDDEIRRIVRSWRTEVLCGTEVSLPGMPRSTFTDVAEFDLWRVRLFSRLYPVTD